MLKKIFAFLLLPSSVFAAEGASIHSNPTLDLLVKKGIISPAERDQVMKDSTPVKTVDTKQSPFFVVDPILKHLTFTGRLQTQYFYGNYEQHGQNAGTANNTNEIFFRRLYLGVKADLDKHFSATLVANFAEPVWTANRSLDRAFMTWEDNTLGSLDVGFKKVQWGVEENTSSSRLLAVERSMTNRFWGEAAGSGSSIFSPPTRSTVGGPSNIGFGARHMGLFYTKKWSLDEQNSLEYMSSLVEPQQGWPDRSVSVMGVFTSLAYTFKLNEHHNHVMGLNYGNTPSYSNSALFATPTSCGTTVGSIAGFNPYIKSEWDKLIVQAEYVVTHVGAGSGQTSASCNNYVSRNPNGYTAIIAYKLIPQLEAVIRYSALNTDGIGTLMNLDIRDGVTAPLTANPYDKVRSYYAGLNYYISGNNIKLQLGYDQLNFFDALSWNGKTTTKDNSTAVAHTIRAQFQLNW